MKPDLFWIPGPWLGRLAIAARPRGGEWLYDELSSLHAAGVDVVVSLLTEEETVEMGLADEAKAAEAARVEYTSFPIPDRGVPSSDSGLASLIAAISKDLMARKNVAFHCRQGLGRSGLIAAAVLVASGLDPERAIETISLARGQAIPETREQRAWIQELPFLLPVPSRG
jgi:protein-tyrosine phosphatase